MPKRKKSAFYGVRRGHIPGVYQHWEDCKRQVTGFPGTEYKGFPSQSEAEEYVQGFLKTSNSTRSEAEEYIAGFMKTSNSKQISNQFLQVHSDQSELFKLIEENGHQFVSFQSMESVDKYLDIIRQMANINNCEASSWISTTWDHQIDKEEQVDDRDRDGQSKVTENKYKGFSNCSEAEKHVEESLKTSNPVQDSVLSLQGHSDRSELFELIEENGQQFGAFLSVESLDKYLDFIRQSGNANNCEARKSICIAWDHQIGKDDKDTDVQPEGVCQLEFDGASKGNPGKAGAGALLRCPHGHVVLEMMESVGIATNNVAEYRSLILGLEGALSKGVARVRAQGDSKLVCMQVLGGWKVRQEHLIPLHNQVKELEKLFKEFSIMHVERALNSKADTLANNAVFLEESETVRKILRPVSKCCV